MSVHRLEVIICSLGAFKKGMEVWPHIAGCLISVVSVFADSFALKFDLTVEVKRFSTQGSMLKQYCRAPTNYDTHILTENNRR